MQAVGGLGVEVLHARTALGHRRFDVARHGVAVRVLAHLLTGDGQHPAQHVHVDVLLQEDPAAVVEVLDLVGRDRAARHGVRRAWVHQTKIPGPRRKA